MLNHDVDDTILRHLATHPFLSAADLEVRWGVATATMARALARLRDAGRVGSPRRSGDVAAVGRHLHDRRRLHRAGGARRPLGGAAKGWRDRRGVAARPPRGNAGGALQPLGPDALAAGDGARRRRARAGAAGGASAPGAHRGDPDADRAAGPGLAARCRWPARHHRVVPTARRQGARGPHAPQCVRVARRVGLAARARPHPRLSPGAQRRWRAALLGRGGRW